MLKNHPRGLMVLFFTEMWERFGFYTLNAVFILYMEEKLGWNDKWKGYHYGFFLGAVYLIPILGGFLGDRVFGQRKTITFGAVLMAIGYGGLTFSSSSVGGLVLFYAGLLLVATGTGLFKANISVLVGNLYEEGSKLKDAAFNIFYMGVNLGAMLGPLAATFLHNRFGSYNPSFGAAAAGMVLSMVIFWAGRKHLVSAQPIDTGKASSVEHSDSAALSREDLQRILSLGILFITVIFFWITYYQNGSSLTLFAQRSTRVYGWLKPETYQVFNPLFILALTPVLVAVFGRMRTKGLEPSSASKICAGLFILGLSMLVMVFAALAGGDRDEPIMSPLWLISSYFLVTIAEIMVSPMGLSYVSQVAPKRMRGLMMGFWFSATAVGSLIAGLMAGWYKDLSHHSLFLIITVLPVFASLLTLPFLQRLNRFSMASPEPPVGQTT